MCVFHLDVIGWAENKKNKKINWVSMDKQILLCSRCDLGPAISHGDKHNTKEWTVLLPTHIKAPVHVHTRVHAEREEDKTSIVPNKCTSKHTKIHPIITGWSWNKSGKGLKLKEDNVLSLYSLFVQSSRQSPYGKCTQMKGFRVEKIKAADSKIGCCFRHIQVGFCVIKRRNKGICCHNELWTFCRVL